jgi:ribonuclease G
VVEERPKPDAYLMRVNPKVAAELLRGDSGLHDFESDSGKHFHFEGGDALPIDSFEVIEAGTREQIEARALPFQVGDEVLVTVEEPHMYNANDAIARVDSYIVSIAGAGRHVGERRLVRIESVDRAAATARMLGEDGQVPEPNESESNGDALESGSRRGRRGRRGGRGRKSSVTND